MTHRHHWTTEQVWVKLQSTEGCDAATVKARGSAAYVVKEVEYFWCGLQQRHQHCRLQVQHRVGSVKLRCSRGFAADVTKHLSHWKLRAHLAVMCEVPRGLRKEE